MNVKRRSPWFRYFPAPKPRAELTLYCCHHAGGAASTFRNWAGSLPPWLDVCAVQLPGRESRIADPLLRDMGSVSGALAESLQPHVGAPYAIFGHSLGALVAFETVRALRRQALPLPRVLIVSGCTPPRLRRQRPAYHNLPDEFLTQRLLMLGGASDEALKHQELRELVLHVLRADLELVRTYIFTPEAPLDCPIVALSGNDDREISSDELDSWRLCTSARFASRRFPGGHFYIRSAWPELAAALTSILRV